MVTRSERVTERMDARCSISEDAPEHLLRTLVQSIRTTAPARIASRASAVQPDAEEILCDMEVDGARYLLVRLPHVDRAKVELSPREYEIARMIARGQHNKAIAGVLNISSWTVATHLRRMFSKLGVNSRAALVARLAESDARYSDDR